LSIVDGSAAGITLMTTQLSSLPDMHLDARGPDDVAIGLGAFRCKEDASTHQNSATDVTGVVIHKHNQQLRLGPAEVANEGVCIDGASGHVSLGGGGSNHSARLTLHGPAWSASGPHINHTTSEDGGDRPALQTWVSGHAESAITFGAFRDGGNDAEVAWTPSVPTQGSTAYQLLRRSDLFHLRTAVTPTPAAWGSSIADGQWGSALTVDAARGRVGIWSDGAPEAELDVGVAASNAVIRSSNVALYGGVLTLGGGPRTPGFQVIAASPDDVSIGLGAVRSNSNQGWVCQGSVGVGMVVRKTADSLRIMTLSSSSSSSSSSNHTALTIDGMGRVTVGEGAGEGALQLPEDAALHVAADGPVVFSGGSLRIRRAGAGNATGIVGSAPTAGSYAYVPQRLGVGTRQPRAPLHVVGGGAIVEGVVQASSYEQLSDARLKRVLRDVSAAEALDKVRQLRALEYEWKDVRDMPEKLGFLAQEVRDVLPEAVSSDSEGMLRIDVCQLVAALVGAVQQLSAEVEGLKRRPCSGFSESEI
jgi:hypothetical protein